MYFAQPSFSVFEWCEKTDMVDQLNCINEVLGNDVLLVSKILLSYEEALWLKR